MPESPYPMILVEEALAIIDREVKPLPTVTMSFNEALGLVLAEDIVADEPMPPFPAASVDGFAVIAADGSQTRRIVGDQMAGYLAGLPTDRRPGPKPPVGRKSCASCWKAKSRCQLRHRRSSCLRRRSRPSRSSLLH